MNRMVYRRADGSIPILSILKSCPKQTREPVIDEVHVFNRALSAEEIAVLASPTIASC